MRLAPLVAALLLSGCLAPFVDVFRADEVEAPEWRVGDWWTYRLSSEVFALDEEVTVVVANLTRDGYVLGTPADADATQALLFHMPALGLVRDDLAYDVHERRFEPMRFPLEDGLTWETTWINANVRLTAKFENATWNITNDGYEEDAQMRYDIVYDPAAKWLRSFVRTGLDGRVRQAVELVANGTGYEGDVRAVGSIQVAALHSRTSGSLSGTTPAAPNPTFTRPEGNATLLVACIVGGQPGQYHAEVRSPTGVVCQLDESFQPGDESMRSSVVEVPDEPGQWEARLVALGQGSATAEVLAYGTYVVTLGGNATAQG